MNSLITRLKIGPRVYGVVGLLAMVAIGLSVLGVGALMRYERQSSEMERATNLALIAKDMNALVYAVVMDSRGVYMAKDEKEARRFGTPLIKNLGIISERLATWERLNDQLAGEDFARLKDA